MTKIIVTLAAITSLLAVTTVAQAHRSPVYQAKAKAETLKAFLDRKANERGR